MKSGAFRVYSGSKGQALMETAIVLPLLVVLVVGVFELSRAIQANNIIANMSRETANLAARTNSNYSSIMNAVGDTAQPLNMTSYGAIYITVVQGNAKGQAVIVYNNPPNQTKWTNGGYTPKGGSQLGSPPATSSSQPTVTTLPTGTLHNGEVAYVAEVFYNYQEPFLTPIHLQPTLYSMSIF